MSQTTYGSADDLLTRASASLTRWVLGLGLLSLHATVYTVALIGMVLWNIYDSPSNIWVDEVFYRWTAVLAFHGIAVACGWTAWRLMRSEQAAVLEAQRSWTPVSTTPYRAPEAIQPNSGWHVPTPEPLGFRQRSVASAHRADDLAKRALTHSAAWSATFARRTMDAVTHTATKVTHRHAEPAQPTASPIQTWPEAPKRHRTDEAEFIQRFAGPPAGEPGSTAVASDAADTVLHVTTRQPTESNVPPPVKEPGQSWIEAATSAWHGPLDNELSQRQNGHRADAANPDTPAG